METKRSISKVFLFSMLLVTFISIGLLGCLWLWQQHKTFLVESEDLREMMLSSYQEMLKTQVKRSVDYIEYRKSLTEERLRSSIRERIYEVHAMASHLFETYKDHLPPEDIQGMIIESLRAVRFNQGRGYFFIADLDGTERLFADRPEMEGKNMLKVQGGKGEYVVRDMISLVKQHEEGFYQYDWSRPGTAGGTFPKIAFVKRFASYNWIIGTGEYLEDVEANIQAEVLKYLATIRFGQDGYVFVTQWNGLDLVGPAKGRNMLNVTDVNGVKIVQEFIRLAKSDGGFLKYVMPKFKGMKPDPKLSYVQGIKDWQWYVGAGVYIDDIEKAIEAKRNEMVREIFYSLIQVTVVLLGLIGFAFFYARHVSRKARTSFELFTAFFNKGARESAVIDPNAMKYEEFENLAHSANQMIEARKQAQLDLKESEEKYRLIVENLNDLIIKLDQNKNLIFASPTFCAMFAKTENEILRQGFLALVIEADREMVGKSLNDLDKPPFTSYHENRAESASGLRWLAWSSRAILDSGGKPVEYVAVGRDITEKKGAEEALRENQEWLQNILDSIQAGVVVIDPETHMIIELNRAAAEMIGTEKERIVNRLCHNFICPNDIGTCPVTDIGLSIEQSERELLKVDSSRIPILKTVNSATINGKKYLIESFLDLSDKKRLESMLLQAQKMEAIGTLAGGIAHDFNNILSPIMLYSEMAMMELPTGNPIHQHLQYIHKAGERAKDLVKQILTVSRVREEDRIPLKVSTIVKETLRFLRSTIPTTVSIQYDFKTERDTVLADPTQMNQIVMNLCTNAAHAMQPKGGILEICLSDEYIGSDEARRFGGLNPGHYLRLTVSDTGSGISQDIIDKIFEPYFTTKGPGEGTGLGLAVVHGIVKSYGGSIFVKSEIEKGTSFMVLFPIIETDVSLKRDAEIQLPKGSERILLVDDEKVTIDAMQLMLQRLGYQVKVRTSSIEALEVFRNNSNEFDLIITDMTMPNMTGKELAKELILIRPDIPIILCTGFSEQIDEKTAEEIGISAFVMKPIVMGDMARIIRNVLEKSKNSD